MNTTDALKFIEIFIELSQVGGDELLKVTENDIARIQKQFPTLDTYLNHWEKYLYAKDNEFGESDGWDEWYDTLTFDKITDREKAQFDLPEDKIELQYSAEEVLMYSAYDLAKEFVESTKENCTEKTHMTVFFFFRPTGFAFGYFSTNPKYSIQARQNIKSKYSKTADALTEIVKQFKSETGIGVEFDRANGQDARPGSTTTSIFHIHRNSFSSKKVELTPEYAINVMKIIPYQELAYGEEKDDI